MGSRPPMLAWGRRVPAQRVGDDGTVVILGSPGLSLSGQVGPSTGAAPVAAKVPAGVGVGAPEKPGGLMGPVSRRWQLRGAVPLGQWGEVVLREGCPRRHGHHLLPQRARSPALPCVVGWPLATLALVARGLQGPPCMSGALRPPRLPAPLRPQPREPLDANRALLTPSPLKGLAQCASDLFGKWRLGRGGAAREDSA